MRLIDSEKLIEYCNNQKFKTIDANDIARFPTVDAAPVVHGKWGISEYEFFYCSICGNSYYNGCECTSDAKELLRQSKAFKYCPYCGAKMDGVKEE